MTLLLAVRATYEGAPLYYYCFTSHVEALLPP